MLKDASLPKSFWSDALTCAAYLRNRLPATFLDGKTPIEAISGRQPNMAYIRRFGQHCYIVHPSGRKPDDRGSKCILLGFASLGYKVLELSTRRVTFSRHCAFVDDFGVSSHSVDLSSFDTVFAPDSSGPIPVNDNGSSTSISLDDVDTVDVANPPPVSLQQEGEMPTTPVSDGGTSQVDPLQSSSTDSSRDEPAINETEVNFDGNEHANGETEDTIGDETPVSSDPIQPADPGFQPDQYYGPLDEDLVERITKLALRLMNLVIIGPPVQIVCQTSSSPLEMALCSGSGMWITLVKVTKAVLRKDAQSDASLYHNDMLKSLVWPWLIRASMLTMFLVRTRKRCSVPMPPNGKMQLKLNWPL
ncbi:hypothetical protein Ae201684P_019938 [Aphanomyces euteiches]|nr:hypothetical protein Ae201684P_019938 [Aphanomyces euteiches]